MSVQKQKLSNKMHENAERLEEFERNYEEKRKKLIKKMQTVDKRREEFLKTKFDKILSDKKDRDEKFEKCLLKQKDFEMNEYKRRADILANQTICINRSMSIDRKNELKRLAAGDNIINNQIAIVKSMFIFNKKLNDLKSRSVFKMTKEEKLKIFRELKRKEAEKRKKELEDKMLDKMIK